MFTVGHPMEAMGGHSRTPRTCARVRGHAAAALLLAVGSVAATPGVEYPLAAPGAPCNLSVAVTHQSAELRWMHAHHDEGGLATHYVVKWQVKDSEEVHWHPDWLGVGSETLQLAGLFAGNTYGVRVAAVNQQGRAWSAATTFRLLAGIPCEANMRRHWMEGGLIDQREANELCGPAATWRVSDPETRGSACSGSYTAYALAGIAAGATFGLVIGAGLLRHPPVAPVPNADEAAEREEREEIAAGARSGGGAREAESNFGDGSSSRLAAEEDSAVSLDTSNRAASAADGGSSSDAAAQTRRLCRRM